MEKKIKLIIFTVALVILAGCLYFGIKNNIFAGIFESFNKPRPDVSGVVLFYKDGCAHCEDVEKYIKDNNIEGKVQFTRLEVSKNLGNEKLLLEKAVTCGLGINQVGVPFLWDGEKCIIGGPDVIQFFKDKTAQ
jgi:glutaredoxin